MGGVQPGAMAASRALLYALLGGICVLLGAGALAAAIILTLTLRK